MGLSTVVLAALFACLLGLLAGYASGRRRGLAEGMRLMTAKAPLLLRREALETKQCPVCDSHFGHDSGSPAELPEPDLSQG